MKRTKLGKLFEGASIGQEVLIKGWIRSVRKSKTFSFLMVYDGTCQDILQIVIDEDIPNYEEISSMRAGFCISARGVIKKSEGKDQLIEMKGASIEILGDSPEDYPLQKKKTSLEFLREIAHLRPRTNTYGAIFRVRHALSFATHQFFNDRGFFYLNSPIITGSDCEGAGEMFQVTTLNLENTPRDSKGQVKFKKDYFSKATYLTVSGQLNAEAFAMAMDSVYTFGPTFRAENSNTSRHLSEFWMVEPEVAFADLDDIIDLATDYLKYLITYVMEKCHSELLFLQKMYSPNLLKTLKHVKETDFKKISYTEAIDILVNVVGDEKFEYEPQWGKDLQTEHERYLTEKHFKCPVIVTDYPKDIKAFYMKQNDDGKTVKAMDILVPGIGEIIGGSQREENLVRLEKRIEEMEMDFKDYQWYLDLRKYGTATHSGFGLGFERAVMYITGMSNIRDVVPFPRTPKNADF